MAFNIFETSRNRGAPVELFRFRYGVFHDQAHCYTDGEKEIVHQGLTYKPLPIKRSGISSSTEDSGQQALEINLPGNAEICEMFRVSAPPGQIALTIFQGHSRDPASEFIASWVGRVGSCGWTENDAKLSCESARTQLRRLALRRHYQYMCPHVLFGDQCRASEIAATITRSVAAVNGRFVTVNSTPPNHQRYVGGFVKYTDARGILHARSILAASPVDGGGNLRLSLSGVFEELQPGISVSVVRGCSHDVDGCLTHANILNFGGMPYIPVKSPLGMNGAFS